MSGLGLATNRAEWFSGVYLSTAPSISWGKASPLHAWGQSSRNSSSGKPGDTANVGVVSNFIF